MLEAIRRALAGRPSPAREQRPTADDPDAVQFAACALLLELAHADEEFTADERRHIQDALTRHFDLSPEAASGLMAQAEDRMGEAIDLHQFTSVIERHYDQGQRMVLAEVLWGIVYADGELSRHESYLMRKLATLLDLKPGYLAEARRKVAPGGTEAGDGA